MNYANQQIVDALNLQLIPFSQENARAWYAQSELRSWHGFFSKDPTRASVLVVSCNEMNVWANEMPVPDYRLWVHNAFVDNQIALHYAIAPSEFFDNRFEASMNDLFRDGNHYTPVLGHEQAFALNPVFAEGVAAIRARLEHLLPHEEETYNLRFAAGVHALRELMLADARS